MNKMSTQECQDSKSQLVYFMNNNFMYDSVLRKNRVIGISYMRLIFLVFYCVREIFRKNNIFYPLVNISYLLIRTGMCAY